MDLASLFGDVPEDLRPNPPQYLAWGSWIIAEHGVDVDGYFDGWCPLHDPHGNNTDDPTAQYRFNTDVFRCLAEPSCHHPKRGMTINDLASRMSVAKTPMRGEPYLTVVAEYRQQLKKQVREARMLARQEQRAIRRAERELAEAKKLEEAMAKYGPDSIKRHNAK